MKTMTRRRTIEPCDYVAMLRRMIGAAGVRVGHGDPEDVALLLGLQDDLAEAVQASIEAQRATGITWESIGEAVGTTRQAAIMRWGRR